MRATYGVVLDLALTPLALEPDAIEAGRSESRSGSV
jgi:hypothetical protein